MTTATENGTSTVGRNEAAAPKFLKTQLRNLRRPA
jgi:hypothetical protein